VSGKAFVVYDFVAPRGAHIDTVDLAAINPKAPTSGKEPVFHRTKFRTAGTSFNFGPEEFNFNLQSDVTLNSHCVLMARSYTFTSDGSEKATNRLDVSATKTGKSLLVSTTVRKPGKTRLTLCSSSNKKTYDLTHAIVSRTTNGNQLVTCVSPVGNRFEGSNLYALDTTLPSSSPSARRGAPRPFMTGPTRSTLQYAEH